MSPCLSQYREVHGHLPSLLLFRHKIDGQRRLVKSSVKISLAFFMIIIILFLLVFFSYQSYFLVQSFKIFMRKLYEDTAVCE